jgi:hypothetical protein
MRRTAAIKDDDQAVLTIRVPAILRDQIDDALSVRQVKIPRNTWILEAVVEKLAREGQQGKANGSR